jgi:UDP-MurNAc hydroxylase
MSTGHAGLFVETRAGSILCDPWRTPAYFASWFVFPDNSAIDFASLRPDYLYVSHLHQDHFDPELLRMEIPKSTTVLLPDFPTDDLREALEGLGFRSFVKMRNAEPIEVDGLRVLVETMSSPADGPLGDSALAVDDGECRLLNQNDSRPRDFQPILEFGPYDAHTLQFSGAIWWPVVYRLADATKEAIGRRKRAHGMARAMRFVEEVGAAYVLPNSGPAAFLDDELFSFNDLSGAEDNPFPDQKVFVDYLAGHGHDNGRLLIPGSVAELTRSGEKASVSCTVTHPVGHNEVERIFSEKKSYLEAYAAREKGRIAELAASWPRYGGDVVDALAEWFEPLMALADHIGPGVGAPVLLSLEAGSGDTEEVVIDFSSGTVRRRTDEECRYQFFTKRRLVEALLATHQVDWVNSLFLSLRFQAWRRGQYNEYLYTFFKCLAPDRLSYAEGWYAEKEPLEFVQIGEFMVQRRCPHLKADLTRFGELEDGVLRCCMHGWRFDLATGACLTSESHRIESYPVGGPPAEGEA